jgi:hypothetical protein
MTEIKIPFGQDASGAVVSIDAVVRGLDCKCFCCSCGAALVARKGEKNQHHFAHYSESLRCVEARETALHKFAKSIICETLELRLPDGLDLGDMQSAEREQWLDGIRPDVLVQFAEPIAVEIFVAHRVPTEKIQKLVSRKLATLEIDLSGYRDGDRTEQEWRELVLRTARRFWLFPPLVERQRVEREAQEAAQRERDEQARVEAHRRRELERREAIHARHEREREWQRLVSEQQLRRQQEREERYRAIQEYEKELEALAEHRFLQGLKICADTKFHLDQWANRKREVGG